MAAKVYDESWPEARKWEAKVADTIRAKGFRVTHHSQDDPLNPQDLTVHHGKADLPVEVKRRPTLRWGQYDGPFLDVAKVHAILAESEVMLFVVVPHDLTQQRAWITQDDLLHLDIDVKDVHPDHHDPDDPLDKGDPKYVIPYHWFKRLDE